MVISQDETELIASAELGIDFYFIAGKGFHHAIALSGSQQSCTSPFFFFQLPMSNDISSTPPSLTVTALTILISGLQHQPQGYILLEHDASAPFILSNP